MVLRLLSDLYIISVISPAVVSSDVRWHELTSSAPSPAACSLSYFNLLPTCRELGRRVDVTPSLLEITVQLRTTSVVCEFVGLNELIALGDFTEIVLDIQCLILLTSFDPDVSFLGGRDGDGHLWCCASYRKYGDDDRLERVHLCIPPLTLPYVTTPLRIVSPRDPRDP